MPTNQTWSMHRLQVSPSVLLCVLYFFASFLPSFLFIPQRRCTRGPACVAPPPLLLLASLFPICSSVSVLSKLCVFVSSRWPPKIIYRVCESEGKNARWGGRRPRRGPAGVHRCRSIHIWISASHATPLVYVCVWSVLLAYKPKHVEENQPQKMAARWKRLYSVLMTTTIAGPN